MALIKCIECGQDISTEAKVCPHCGKPQAVPPVQSSLTSVLLSFIILGLILWGVNLALGKTKILSKAIGGFKAPAPLPIQKSLGTLVVLQEVNNLGYTFYIGQIDNKDVNITDDLKNQITKIAYDAHFPLSLLKTIPIIILNNIALTGDQYIQFGGKNMKIPELKADFLSEGGLYVTFSNASPLIIINKPIIAQGLLQDVLTHELGHAIGAKITDEDWKKFYQLRNIPAETPRFGSVWNLSPAEDFAEVYKSIFTGLQIKTFYGILTSRFGTEIGSCMKIHSELQSKYTPNVDYLDYALGKVKLEDVEPKISADPQMQACRRDVISNPEKYKEDWALGTPYISTVNVSVKDFIGGIANTMNK